MWIPPLHLLALLATAPADTTPAGSGPSVNGLYPLWEQTGILHAANTGQVGYQHAQLSLGWLQFGTQPFLDLYGTANLQVKGVLWSSATTHVAWLMGGYRIPVAAEGRSLGNLNPVSLANPYGPMLVAPLSVAATFSASSRLDIHTATTALVTRASDGSGGTNISVGKSVLAELWATPEWAARLHVGLEGVGVAPRAYAGISFGYTGHRLALQAGYARAWTFEGESSQTVMFDGALLFR